MKICTKCGIKKRANAFYRNDLTKDGLRSECKECSKDMTRLYRQKQKGNMPQGTINLAEMEELWKQLGAKIRQAKEEMKHGNC